VNGEKHPDWGMRAAPWPASNSHVAKAGVVVVDWTCGAVLRSRPPVSSLREVAVISRSLLLASNIAGQRYHWPKMSGPLTPARRQGYFPAGVISLLALFPDGPGWLNT